jgi:hypothetical protein
MIQYREILVAQRPLLITLFVQSTFRKSAIHAGCAGQAASALAAKRLRDEDSN